MIELHFRVKDPFKSGSDNGLALKKACAIYRKILCMNMKDSIPKPPLMVMRNKMRNACDASGDECAFGHDII